MGYKFVLVHGSWQDARSWDAVTPLLERTGHQVWTPTIAGHAPSAAKNVSHAECVASVVDFIRHHGVSDFVLVGHSFGGTIIQRVAEELPERIRRLVFWNAFVLNDGDNLDSNTPPHYRALFEQIAQPDGSAMLPFPIWREVFLNDADFALANRIYDERLSPAPRRSHTDAVHLKTFFSFQIPKSYLNCTEDIALPPGAEWGLASAHVEPPWPLSPRANARQPSGEFHQSRVARAQDRRGRPRLNLGSIPPRNGLRSSREPL